MNVTKQRGTIYILPIPAPGSWVASNDHTHWRNRHAGVKAWRETAAWRAKQARLPKITSPYAIHATVHKATRHLFDLDGIVPSVKACVDGLRDAGVLEQDDFRHMVRLVVEAGEADPETPRLMLRIEELPVTPPKEWKP